MAEVSTSEFVAVKKITLLQATFRGHLTRKKIRKAQELYRDIVMVIEGSAIAEDLEWVVHGCLPIPVHKHKEPELAVFMRRLAERDGPEKTTGDVDLTRTSNSDSDTGTTTEKYSSITSQQSSILSGKRTSLVVEDFTVDGDNKADDRKQTSEAKDAGGGQLDGRPDVNMETQTAEGSLNQETFNRPNKSLKIDGRRMSKNGESENLAGSTETLTIETESRVDSCQEGRNIQPQIGQTNDVLHQNFENKKGTGIQREDDDDGSSRRGGRERNAPCKQNDPDVNLMERKDQERILDADTMTSLMELVGDDNVDKRLEREEEYDEMVNERLQGGPSMDDEDDGQKDVDKLEASKLFRGVENVVEEVTSYVDEESKQYVGCRENKKRPPMTNEGDDRGISREELTSISSNGDGFRENVKKSTDDDDEAGSVVKVGTFGELHGADDIVRSMDDIEQIQQRTHKEKKKGERMKRDHENDGIPFTPPSPILCQSLPDGEQDLSASSHDYREITDLSETNRLGDRGSDVNGDSTVFTKVTSLGGSLMSEQTSVWDSDSADTSLIGTSSFPEDLTQLQALRKDIAMELLWVQQAIDSRTSYLKLKASLEDKTKRKEL